VFESDLILGQGRLPIGRTHWLTLTSTWVSNRTALPI